MPYSLYERREERMGAIICGAVGIAVILIIYLPLVAEKKRQEEHQREIEEVKKRHDEWALVELRANLAALESKMMGGEEMSRLIDADKLEPHEIYDDNGFTEVVYMDDIREMPTVEADVVRCKDCHYAKPFNKIWQLPIKDTLVCTHWANDEVDENFFCGYAIKKMDEVEGDE